MISTNAQTKLLGLLGNPVGHSLSPIIHSNLAKNCNENYAYLAFAVETQKLADAVKGGYALGVQGFNVTVPHKKEVMQYLADVDDKAALIGAVNTLVRTETGFKGYNTDMPGLLRAMAYDGICLKGKHVVILGAGGVANAAVCAMLEADVAGILVLNRTVQKALELADYFNRAYGTDKVRAAAFSDDFYSVMEKMDSDDSKQSWIAIQATSVGMYPNVTQCVMEDEKFYKKVAVGYDLIMNPAVTMFMKRVKQSGGEAYNGVRMLLFQGVLAYELWTGHKISDELATKVLHILENN